MRSKSEEKRQAILDMAATVFREMGFERTSMAEICNRLGGSKATLYNYFPSKEALFMDMMFQASEEDFRCTLQTLQTDDPDIAAALRNYGERLLGMLYRPEVMAARRLLVAEGGRAGLGTRCFDQGPRRTHEHVGAFLQRAMDRGLLRPANTQLATLQLQALLEAELLPGMLFHHVAPPIAVEIAACTERAIAAFLQLYAPQA